jgi:hypothetical protein
MAAGLTDHVWTLREVLLYRARRGHNLMRCKGVAKRISGIQGKTRVLAMRSIKLQEVQKT